MRACRKCGEVKPLDRFVKNRECQDGYAWTCKACDKARRGARPARELGCEDPAELRACRRCGFVKSITEFTVSRGYREHTCRDCTVERVRARKRVDPDASRTYYRDRYRREGPENALGLAIRQCRSGAAKRGAVVIEDVVPLVVLERDDGVCGICGHDVDPFDFHVDHLVAVLDGGEHSYENVQLAHPLCNLRKGVEERDARRRRGAAA